MEEDSKESKVEGFREDLGDVSGEVLEEVSEVVLEKDSEVVLEEVSGDVLGVVSGVALEEDLAGVLGGDSVEVSKAVYMTSRVLMELVVHLLYQYLLLASK